MTGVDEAQWIRQYELLEKPLYNVVYRWLWDAAESQDVVHEAFLRCWQKRGEIRSDGFKALVFKIALNLASNRCRRKKLWRMVPFHSVQQELVAEETDADLLSKPLREALDSLPEPLKRVLLLSELGGMSYGEIAAVLGIKEGTVGSRRNRALLMLRQRLEAMGVTWDEC